MKTPSAAERALDRTLAARLESAHEWAVANYVASLKSRRPELGAAELSVGGGHAFFAGPSPFSFAVNLGLSRAITAAELDEVERFYTSRGVAPKVDITPATDPSLSRLTHERGYHVADLTSVLLLHLRDAAIEPVPDVVVRWGAPHDCELWVDTIARNFYVTDPGEARRKSIACVFHAPHALNVMATVNGEVAGVAGMMVPSGDGIAVIYGSCTSPEFRRMGVHREMLRLRVETARSAGCDAVIATALPGSDSERNLIRCGFELCYVKTSWAK